jgi:hypothetical protein
MENANKEDAITVAVTRDGKTFLGGDQVNARRSRQQDRCRPRSQEDQPTDDKSVYLRADQRANYGKVMDTIDAVRTAGVSQLNLLTDMSVKANLGQESNTKIRSQWDWPARAEGSNSYGNGWRRRNEYSRIRDQRNSVD